ncbi:methyltransferase [Rhodobacterales bacterium HKCCE2091]|nr:methyltransferase [Rhodobacterales bacterium HKCCE2091]
MSDTTGQYDAYPYPDRDPADEAKRLVTGSPSHPLELDHFLFGGKRDWSRPFKALIAGGGTGDALIQMAQVLTSAGKPYEITYLDLSTSARKIAEARAAARGLGHITFVTGSLLDAPGMGPFDYIDCCGVLHHLEEPQAGFDALAGAVTDAGGIGLMVYAPYGRSGVYPLQEAFRTILRGTPRERLKKARAIFGRVPEGHPFKTNPHLGDHKESDAGFYDLLLHSRDRAFPIRDLMAAIETAGLELVGQPQAHLYDPMTIVGDANLLRDFDRVTRMELAEKLGGGIRTHIAYVAKTAEGRIARPDREAVPHLKGVSGPKLSQAAAKSGVIPVSYSGARAEIPVAGLAARSLTHVDGRKTLAEIARASGLDPIEFASIWRPLSDALTQYGLMYYSRLLRG